MQNSPLCNPNSKDNLRVVLHITWLGAWINLGLSALKMLAGILGHSQVLIADAVHSLSDLVTDIAVLVGARFWTQPADDSHPHGHAKIEALVTFFIGAVLTVVAFNLTWNATESLHKLLTAPESESQPTWLAFIAAVISILVKEFLYGITVWHGKRIHSSALIANAWHHRSDALSSIPAAVAVGTCILLGPHYAFLDPVGTILVSLMIIHASWKIVYPTLGSLLDAGTTQEDVQRIHDVAGAVPGVFTPHSIRIRQVGGGGIAVDMHIEVRADMTVLEAHNLSHDIERVLLAENLGVVDVAIHIEPQNAGEENVAPDVPR